MVPDGKAQSAFMWFFNANVVCINGYVFVLIKF